MSSDTAASQPTGSSPSPISFPTTSRTLPRPSPALRGHPNKATHGGGGDQRVSQGIRLARHLAGSGAASLGDAKFAEYMDVHDRLGHLRHEFHIPSRSTIWPEAYKLKLDQSTRPRERADDEEGVYLAGNSLGCMPRSTPDMIAEELSVWRKRGVLAHVEHPLDRAWVSIDDIVTPFLAEIVGANPSEVACMGSLTANLHALFTSFYKPTPRRHKIMYEGKAFPSDIYAFASQVSLHDYPPSSLLPVDPLPGEFTIRTSEILKIIEEQGDSIAIICFGAVQYYSGQYFDLKAITDAGHAKGCLVAFDCAHAVGNVELKLHEWGVDFAAWCSYKYLNAGPGAIAGIYVHERHEKHDRLQGWWGHDLKTRFAMPSTFSPTPGASGWQFSNPSVLDVIALRSALDSFRHAKRIPPTAMIGGHIASAAPILGALREKSIDLTSYLELLLKADSHYVPPEEILHQPSAAEKPGRVCFTIITPADHERRGAQLSLLFHPEEAMLPIFERLREGGVLGDERKPGVIRLAPVPLYNTWADVLAATTEFAKALEEYPRTVAQALIRIQLLEEARQKQLRAQAGVAQSPDGSEPDEGLRRVVLGVEELKVDHKKDEGRIGEEGDDALRRFNAEEERRTSGVDVGRGESIDI
ncbi:hypothetical protein RQP46_004967 [Phenoliferia psychrophenolica]